MANSTAPRDLDAEAFANWLTSVLQLEGWTPANHRHVEDWLYEQTGRTVLPKVLP